MWSRGAGRRGACRGRRSPAASTPTKAKKAKSAPTPVKRFRSHCVEDSAEGMSPEMLTVKELKAKLSALGAPTGGCLLYTSPSPRDATLSRMPSSA